MVDNLPHFLLLLLILQRFDDAKWGYFTECPQSGVISEPVQKLNTFSFGVDKETGERVTVVFYPDHHNIYYPGITLIGRATSIIGGRMGPPPGPAEVCDMGKFREGNDLVVKTYWPEENQTSGVEILKKAREWGKDRLHREPHPGDGLPPGSELPSWFDEDNPTVPRSLYRWLPLPAYDCISTATVGREVERKRHADRVFAVLFL